MSKDLDLNQLDEIEEDEIEEPGAKRRSVRSRFKDEKKKTVTSISIPTPLYHAVNEYCEKTGISKAAFFSQLAREKLKNEDLETEF